VVFLGPISTVLSPSATTKRENTQPNGNIKTDRQMRETKPVYERYTKGVESGWGCTEVIVISHRQTFYWLSSRMRRGRDPIFRETIARERDLYCSTTGLSGKRNSTRAHLATIRPFVSCSWRRLITYLAERSVVFAVAVDCRPLPRCSRCGCPAEYYDHCHCSSPNLRTCPQDTSITTTRSSREESRPDTRSLNATFVRKSVRYFLSSRCRA
jgi:hypothetical protein